MHKQLWLEFIEQAGLEALWEDFAEQARREIMEHYARLMAQKLAARVSKATLEKEACDEPSDK
jgi:hypothetical protein